MTTPSEALAVALNGLNRAIDEMWNDEARRVALPERHVKEITRWQAIAQAALRSAPVPSVEEIAGTIRPHLRLSYCEWDVARRPDIVGVDDASRAVLALLTPAETALSAIPVADSGDHVGDVNKMVGGGDGIVERLRSIGISPLASEAAAEIESANEEIKRLNDDVACARSEAFDDALAALAEQEAYFASEQYATGQPMSSFAERFALRRAVHAIFLLKENDR